MLNVPVSEVCLQRSGIVAFVGERVTASVAQHVRVSLEAQPCLDTGTLDHPCEACRGEGRAAL